MRFLRILSIPHIKCLKRWLDFFSAVTAGSGEAAPEGAQEDSARGDQDRGQILRRDPRAGVQVPRALQPPLRQENKDHKG